MTTIKVDTGITGPSVYGTNGPSSPEIAEAEIATAGVTRAPSLGLTTASSLLGSTKPRRLGSPEHCRLESPAHVRLTSQDKR